jgi:hypothetical protein
MHILFRDGHADRAYLEANTTPQAELETHLKTRGPDWAAAITGLSGRGDRGVRPALRQRPGALDPLRLRLHPVQERCRRHARRLLPAHRQGRLAGQGRRRPLQHGRPLPLGQNDDRGPRRHGPVDPPARPVAHRPDPDGRPVRPARRPQGHRPPHPEHQPDVHRARAEQGPPGLRPGRPLHRLPGAVHDRDGEAGRHPAPRHHVPRARRHLPRLGPLPLPDRPPRSSSPTPTSAPTTTSSASWPSASAPSTPAST